MKLKLVASLAASVFALANMAQGAITVSIKNFTSTTAGNPIVNALGTPVPLNSIVASAGIFTTEPIWATATTESIIAAFTAIDSTPLTNSSFTGVFTGADTSTLAAYAPGFDGATPFMLVGNGTTLANSTALAVYKANGTVYQTPVAGVANTAINGTTIGNWVYGLPTVVTTQPSFANAAFTQGIALVGIPEPSAALLGAIGALGLLRRRRN